jgi:hypothetical protein
MLFLSVGYRAEASLYAICVNIVILSYLVAVAKINFWGILQREIIHDVVR